MKIEIDMDRGVLRASDESGVQEHSLESPEAFALAGRAWLRAGWDAKYVYSFAWFGRPIIQLPEDVVRMQELFFQVQPTKVIETGIAHGGSIVFYASLCKILGRGKVIGVDIEIRPHNRKALEEHPLRPWFSLIEGSSVEAAIVDRVAKEVEANDTVMVILDSNHTKAHVRQELEAYARFVTPGSYIVAMDGIMRQVAGAPRTQANWTTDNPIAAVDEFLAEHPEFYRVDSQFTFNEGAVRDWVTYSPGGVLRRR